MAKSKESSSTDEAISEEMKAKKEAQRGYQHTYDLKRASKPRLSGYIEVHEEQMLNETMNLSPYNSKKEVILAAVAQYKASLMSGVPKNNLTITESEIAALMKLVSHYSKNSACFSDEAVDRDVELAQNVLKEICRRNGVV
ncbi:hypothetical protein [Vibrio fluvialis]|uniref:hypothetical protein n=1 Tax=Vibrio fluvialis TaxID=676 RepID=UPI0023A9FE21|nr:hypothetical protein [Vibrio fluvialis]MDE5179143.1 hypothetical protein [Vibrio fluvialis]